MIETLGFDITYKGDPSVGMFEQTWRLSGNFSFDTEDAEEEFIGKLKEAYEYCSDTPVYITSISRTVDNVLTDRKY